MIVKKRGEYNRRLPVGFRLPLEDTPCHEQKPKWQGGGGYYIVEVTFRRVGSPQMSLEDRSLFLRSRVQQQAVYRPVQDEIPTHRPATPIWAETNDFLVAPP